VTCVGGAAAVQGKTRDSLHKTPLAGVVLPEWVRCGKPNCRCAGGELHGPYFYRFWREGGRLRKEYVKRSELVRVRAQCEARRQFRRELKAAWEQLRRLRATVREIDLAINTAAQSQ
jgi:hypothetical protein